jgi:hypothetical protein
MSAVAACVALALILPAQSSGLASGPGSFTPSNFLFLPLVAKPSGANCARTSTGFTPLMDLGTGTYQGYGGGLYAGGSNTPPAAYQQVGITHTQAIQPLDVHGQPASAGRIVLLSIGMSNATQEFSTFKAEADPDAQKNPLVTIVDGAEGGQDAETIKNPNAAYWNFVQSRLSASGVVSQQVQVVWLKEAIAGENKAFPLDAQQLQDDLQAIVQILEQRFPHLQVVYLASRTYGGYATTTLNPEPYAYQSGFAVKWLIDAHRLAGDGGAWLAWGPYLWTDGLAGRSDGLVWTCADVQSDGTHPSTSGRQKVAGLLLSFFKNDALAKMWFDRP